jgi:hypothetical protein
MYVAGADPQAQAAAHPIHGCEDKPNEQPPPVEMQERGEEYIDAIALEDDVIADEEGDSAEGDEGEQL